MKQKDVITGWLVAFIISCMMLTGCTEKAKKPEKKIMKQGTAARHHQPYHREGGSPGNTHHPETGAGCLQKIPAPAPVGNHLGYEMGRDRKQTGTGKGG